MNNRYTDVMAEELKRNQYAHTNLDGVGDTVKAEMQELDQIQSNS